MTRAGRLWPAVLGILPFLAGALLTLASGDSLLGQIPGRTTVIVVRHAEKLSDDEDPSLSDAGRARALALDRVLADLTIDAVYASQYRRTRETLAPIAASRGLTVGTHDARDFEGLARIIREEHAGQVVVVAGHSNTVPGLIRALGADPVADIPDDEYDDLFVVRLYDDGRAVSLHLNYGAPSGTRDGAAG